MGKPKVLALIVYLPVDMAVEIYRESGDLAISKFPYTLKLAESIAEVLDIQHLEINNKYNVDLTLDSKCSKKADAKLTKRGEIP